MLFVCRAPLKNSVFAEWTPCWNITITIAITNGCAFWGSDECGASVPCQAGDPLLHAIQPYQGINSLTDYLGVCVDYSFNTIMTPNIGL